MTVAAGTRLGPYEITRPLGAGGMGEVYRAHDARLGRDVAIKVLPASFAGDADRLRRFEQEARTTGGLNHPNILLVFDVGAHDGAPYLVMELLEGETLRQTLGGRPLPVRRAVEIARCLAQGLAAAHEKGIVHRDLKPENVFLTRDGRIKILDFGLAKSQSSPLATSEDEVPTRAGEAGPSLTEEGTVLGTMGYMSPEQVRGEKLDGRSDLFALGVVLHEMLAGRHPFRRATAADTVAALLREEPEPLTISGELSKGLSALLARCLAKVADQRFQSGSDLAFALESLMHVPVQQTAPADPAEKSIVVLPFENLSPDPDNAFFADGLTEEIIADLAKVQALHVISRTSAMHYKGTAKPLPAIARELNVRHVLEGSVRRAGDSLRITAQLIDASTDGHLWAEKYTGTLDDVFDLQERISRRIVEGLKVTLTPDEDRRLSARPLTDVRALDCYLRAMQQIRTFTEAGLDQAVELTTRALDLVGERALLHATQALVHWQYHNAGIRLDEETLRVADACADRALELDGESSAGFLAKGLVAWTRGRLQDGARHLARAAELDGNSDALAFLSYIYSLADRLEPARAYADQAIVSDPFNPWALWARGTCELLCGDLQTAMDRFRAGVAVAPADPLLRIFQVISLANAGKVEDALVLFEQFAAQYPIYASWAGMWAAALRADRNAVRAGAADLEAYATRDREISWQCADCLAAVGETDEAFRWLANAVRLGFVNHRFFATRDPFLAPLRGDPRFEALMDTAREQERAFKV